MKGVEIFYGIVTPEEVKNNPNKLYVFEENTTKVGNTGPLAIRNLPNAVGLRVRKGPGTKSAAFFTDIEFENNKKIITEDIINIKYLSFCYDSVVLTSVGYGLGSTLELRCSNTWNFLVDVLKYNFDFDNTCGKKWQRFPSHYEIVSSDYLKTFLNDVVINPVNNSFFLPHLLQQNLFTTFDLVKTDNKISITTNQNFEIGKNLILQFQNQKRYIVCRVTLTYPANSIQKNTWSTFEGVTDEFSKSVDLTNYYQSHIKYICTLDESGNIEFRSDYFTSISPTEKEKIDRKLGEIESKIEKSKETKVEINEDIKKTKKEMVAKTIDVKKENTPVKKEVTNQDIYNLLLEINSKLDRKSSKNKLPNIYSFFSRKNLKQLLEEENIFGEIKDINNGNFEVYTEKSIYFVKYKRGFLKNSIEVLLRKDII